MNNVIQFPNSDVKEYRQKCCLMNRAVQVEGEDGELQKYPCIVLYEEETDIPILYTGLERYLCHLVKSELLNGKTLSAKAYLATEWHPTKNGNLKPTDVSAGNGKKVWWYLPYDDPKTGKHFDFEWEASISSRSNNNNGCPYLSNQKIWTGYNDLKTINPKLASEWHPTKNGNLTPEEVGVGYKKKVWWQLPYDDPKTDKHYDFEWKVSVYSRHYFGTGCPYLDGKLVKKGFNDLESLQPEIANEWHPTKNRKLKPDMVPLCCAKKVWWLCEFGHEWRTEVYNRSRIGLGCPYCSGKRKIEK